MSELKTCYEFQVRLLRTVRDSLKEGPLSPDFIRRIFELVKGDIEFHKLYDESYMQGSGPARRLSDTR
jgi:hypothetical protein